MNLQPIREEILNLQRVTAKNRGDAQRCPDVEMKRWHTGRADAFEQAASWIADALRRVEASIRPVVLDDDDQDVRLIHCPTCEAVGGLCRACDAEMTAIADNHERQAQRGR